MLDEQAREDLIERITAIFSNEAEAAAYEADPQGYVDEHLPEGVDGADVAACYPEVAERTGLDFSNVAHSAPHASVAAQISHSYTTIYQQNAFIYAEEGSQVTNIQGNGNAVSQQDIDVDVDFGEGEEAPDEPVEDPMDPVEPEGPVLYQELPEESYEETPEEGGWDEPQDPYEGLELEFNNSATAGAVPEAPEAPAEAPEPVEDVVEV